MSLEGVLQSSGGAGLNASGGDFIEPSGAPGAQEGPADTLEFDLAITQTLAVSLFS